MLPLNGFFSDYGEYGVVKLRGRFSDGHNPELLITRKPSGFIPAESPAAEATANAADSAILRYQVSEDGKRFEANLIGRYSASGPEIGTDNPTDDIPPVLLLHPGQGIGDKEDVKRFSDLALLGRKNQLLERLQRFDSRIVGIEILQPDVRSLLFAVLDSGIRVQCGLLGGGLNRVLQMLISLDYCQGGALFIDEIENGIYYEHMEAVLTSLIDAAANSGTQLLFSTHSRELLHALAQVSARPGAPELTVVHSNRAVTGDIAYGLTHGLRALKAIELAEVR